VVHVSWFEADALARSHGARLPTELEWEKAATWDQETGPGNLDQGLLGPAPVGAYPEAASACGALGMLGDVWEWTSSPFRGYAGFVAHPYREYSEVFFGDGYRVLRGGSWATRSRIASPSFRNWDLPQRRQIFSGVRLAWDA
jgi:gamma-glutamyl hercynylcysteine S-oxide synthase